MEDDIELSGENPGVFCCRHDKNYYLMSEYGTKLTKNYKGIWDQGTVTICIKIIMV